MAEGDNKKETGFVAGFLDGGKAVIDAGADLGSDALDMISDSFSGAFGAATEKAQTDREKGHRGINALIVEAGMEGFIVGEKEDKMGIRGSDTHTLIFNESIKYTTNYFIFKKLKNYNVKISIIARGISIGNELEYTDEVTLARSIANRVPFNHSIKK